MFTYCYHGILATEYEDLTTKMQPLWSQFSQWQKSTMNLIGHTVAFSEVLQSNPANAAAKMFMPFSCIHTLLKSENICQQPPLPNTHTEQPHTKPHKKCSQLQNILLKELLTLYWRRCRRPFRCISLAFGSLNLHSHSLQLKLTVLPCSLRTSSMYS